MSDHSYTIVMTAKITCGNYSKTFDINPFNTNTFTKLITEIAELAGMSASKSYKAIMQRELLAASFTIKKLSLAAKNMTDRIEILFNDIPYSEKH